MSSAASDVVGRDEEFGAIERFLDDPTSWPAVFRIEGEAGIGKTTIWRHGVDVASARSYLPLSCSPTRTEHSLSFAALGDLMEGVLSTVVRDIPQPQARALSVALLLEEAEGTPPDRRAIGLGLLSVIRALTRDAPVLIAIDDAQWLDEPSASALGFALRRLHGEPVAVLASVRTEEGDAAWLPEDHAIEPERTRILAVEPLSMGAIHHLLGEQLGLVLARPKLRRLYELSGGNPFFALELGRANVSGATDLQADEALPRSLASLVEDRVSALPAATRAALLIASALSQPSVVLVERAGDQSAAEHLGPALDAHVIEIEHHQQIRFSHALLASGVYVAAHPWERRDVHRRLAAVVTDPEDRARHLALAATGAHADVASALDDAASSTHARGALRAAAEHAMQAWKLTPLERHGDRHARAIRAADYAFEIGDSGRARTLLDEPCTEASSSLMQARALFRLGTIEEYEGDRRKAVELFRAALDRSEGDRSLRAAIEVGLADVLFVLRQDLPMAARHARTAVELSEEIGDASMRIIAMAVDGLVDAVIGGTRWRESLPPAVRLEEEAGPVHLLETATYSFAVNLTWVDEFDEARALFGSLRALADERAEESALPWLLSHLSLNEFLSGRWDAAMRSAAEGNGLALQLGQDPQRLFALGVQTLIRCARGDDDAAGEARAVLEGAERSGTMIAMVLAATAIGLHEIVSDRFEAAHRALAPVGTRLAAGGVREPGSMRFVADDIEALVALDEREEAEALLVRLEQRARELDRASALAAASRCRGLMAAADGQLDAAIGSFDAALAHHARVFSPFERGRTLLALGSAYRRSKQRRLARQALEEARSIFDDLGAQPWSEKARSGLARIGGRPAATGELTPTEHRVAALVAEGRSNKEVAATLFVTVKTVESNLSRIYAKLGVRSRAELAHRYAVQADGSRTEQT